MRVWENGPKIDPATGVNVLSTNQRNRRFRPQSRKNEISDISPGQKCVRPKLNELFVHSN